MNEGIGVNDMNSKKLRFGRYALPGIDYGDLLARNQSRDIKRLNSTFEVDSWIECIEYGFQ
jgi:hypothetical protein